MQNQVTLRDLQRGLDNAVANQRLEGLEPDAKTVAELRRVVEGELTIAEVLQSVRARISAGEFREVPAK
ncbi:antitoxin VbhA family protein [Achromobacter xylosoxidans]|uniref:antitoxin VbhA family protein n=1 Tax=Alcaligenes xylosoxydans xylosoxydans TaxID=85698 RepID=UPI001F058BAB|nr:antitoxin VbhA family protein [Achromobacter xylosoxidans]MCH1986494.1 antitoxin VbhA family protein [Achromobacter xylosoxidans]MCH1992296.1 antitoxin VbhA family protein [Achromobacter xylosoxidans]MCH4586615.1 antitoxin VbhA family protein [Achromobacter xylosoxidans]